MLQIIISFDSFFLFQIVFLVLGCYKLYMYVKAQHAINDICALIYYCTHNVHKWYEIDMKVENNRVRVLYSFIDNIKPFRIENIAEIIP